MVAPLGRKTGMRVRRVSFAQKNKDLNLTGRGGVPDFAVCRMAANKRDSALQCSGAVLWPMRGPLATATGHFFILSPVSSILSSLECIPLETAGHRLSLPPPPGCPLRAFSMCYTARERVGSKSGRLHLASWGVERWPSEPSWRSWAQKPHPRHSIHFLSKVIASALGKCLPATWEDVYSTPPTAILPNPTARLQTSVSSWALTWC